MVKRKSALDGSYQPGRFGATGDAGIVLALVPDLILHQVATWAGSIDETGPLAASAAGVDSTPGPGKATVGDKGAILRIEPLKWWLIGVEAPSLLPAQGATLDLSHSRTRIRISGPDAVALINRLLPLDLREHSFPEGSVASSALHHVGVTLWRSAGGYDLFIPRGFALSIWEVLFESAQQFGVEVI
jgi:heterotetrameric sarcosine oxidase gamma subunit